PRIERALQAAQRVWRVGNRRHPCPLPQFAGLCGAGTPAAALPGSHPQIWRNALRALRPCPQPQAGRKHRGNHARTRVAHQDPGGGGHCALAWAVPDGQRPERRLRRCGAHGYQRLSDHHEPDAGGQRSRRGQPQADGRPHRELQGIAAAMIVTVTPNTVIDQVLFVSKFEKNHTMRARDVVYSMGGKPTDASWILGELGIPSLALGFAAGAVGRKSEALLRARGVTTDFTEVEGESRLVTVIVDESDHTHSTITTSTLIVNANHVAALRQRYQSALGEATCVVLGGTLPAGVEPSLYVDLITLARERNIPVVFDASDRNLQVGLTARPNFIKPNRDELGALIGHPITTLEDAYRAGCSVLE